MKSHSFSNLRFILVLFIFFALLSMPVRATEDVYSSPVFKIMKKLRSELWRSPIVFDNVGKYAYYVQPGKHGFEGATTFWRYNIDTNAENQLGEKLNGRFSYPSISLDGKKLVCQFQKGDISENTVLDSDFYRHALLSCDLTKEKLEFQEIPLGKIGSKQINEMMPIITTSGDKVIYGSGIFQNISDVDEICHLEIQPFNKSESDQLLKNIETNKCFEFSPLILRSSSGLLSLMNSKSFESNICVYYRGAQENSDYKKIKKIYEPTGIGVFTGHPEMKLDVMWMDASRFSTDVACQVGGWNLFSIVILKVNDGEVSSKVVLRGSKKISYMHPCISANGKWLAYEKCELEMLESPVLSAKIKSTSVYIMNLDTFETKKIADNSAMPAFSPDLSQVLYFDTASDVWSLKAAKTGLKAEEMGLLSRDELSKIDELVNKLGDSNYQTRENAKIALMRLGVNALNKLRQLEKSAENPEIKYRIQEIIEFLESEVPVVPESK